MSGPGVEEPAHGGIGRRPASTPPLMAHPGGQERDGPVVRRVLLIVAARSCSPCCRSRSPFAVTGDPLGMRNQAVATTAATVAPTTVAPTTTTPLPAPPRQRRPGGPNPMAVQHRPGTGYQVGLPTRLGGGQRRGPRTSCATWSPVRAAHRLAAGPAGRPRDHRAAGQPGPRRRARRYNRPAWSRPQFKGLSAALLEFTYQAGETWQPSSSASAPRGTTSPWPLCPRPRLGRGRGPVRGISRGRSSTPS